MSLEHACERLGIGRSRLYTLRTDWLAGDRRLPLAPSGGDHATPWPDEAEAFLRLALATGEPPNFSFPADELYRRFAFKRSASNVRNHVRKHMPELLREPLKRGPKPRRRWQRKGYGDLLQHDSSPHQWWPGEKLQILALTIDDATRFIVGAGFIEAERSSCWSPPPPPALLDLHLAIHHTRVVQKAGEISFLGRRWAITPGASGQVTIVQQPGSFRVIASPPTPQTPQWPDILAEYRI